MRSDRPGPFAPRALDGITGDPLRSSAYRAIPFRGDGIPGRRRGVVTAKLSSSDVSFHALAITSQATTGVPLAVRGACLGKLVRQYEETHRSHHLIVPTRRTRRGTDSLRGRCRSPASLKLAGISASRTVSLHAGKTWVPATRMRSAILDALSSPADRRAVHYCPGSPRLRSPSDGLVREYRRAPSVSDARPFSPRSPQGRDRAGAAHQPEAASASASLEGRRALIAVAARSGAPGG